MDKNEYLMKLVLTCPLHPAYCNCSVKDLKAASISELIEINNRLTDEEISSIIDSHNKCLEARKQLQEEAEQT